MTARTAILTTGLRITTRSALFSASISCLNNPFHWFPVLEPDRSDLGLLSLLCKYLNMFGSRSATGSWREFLPKLSLLELSSGASRHGV